MVVTGPFRPSDPIRMNHPAIPGTENVLERRDIYLSIWRDLGWQSDDVEDNLVFAVPAVIHIVPVELPVGPSVASAVPGVIDIVPVVATPTVVAESFNKFAGAPLGPDLTWTRKVFVGATDWRTHSGRARFQYPPPSFILENFDKTDGTLGPALAWARKVFTGDPQWAVASNRAQFRIGTTSDVFVLGATKPDGSNTGLAAPTTSVSSGSALTVSANDQLFENVRFERRVSVTGKRATFRNCDFVGPVTWDTAGDTALLTCTNTNVEDLVAEHCRFKPQTPDHRVEGIRGHHFTLYRCDISHVVDCIGMILSSGNPKVIRIHGNYLHHMAYFCPDSLQSDNRTHNDLIQNHGNCRDVEIIGNTMVGQIDPAVSTFAEPTFSGGEQQTGYQFFGYGLWGTSCLMMVPLGTLIEDLTIDKNWISGGTVGINNGTWSSATNYRVTNNRWGRDFRSLNASAPWVNDDNNWGIKSGALPVTTTGNVYEDNGTPNNTWE